MILMGTAKEKRENKKERLQKGLGKFNLEEKLTYDTIAVSHVSFYMEKCLAARVCKIHLFVTKDSRTLKM